MKKSCIFGIILVGVTSITAQIILLREFLVIFSGNELSIGIVLTNWLFWTAVGSTFTPRLVKKNQRPEKLFSILLTASTMLFLADILLIRAIPLFFGGSTGEIYGIIPIWLYSFFILSIICFVNGALFVVGCRVLNTVTLAYILESAGSAAGGLLASFILIKYLNAFEIVWLIIMVNFTAAFLILSRNRVFIFFLIFSTGIFSISNMIDLKTRHWKWNKSEILSSSDSVYGNVTLTKYESVYSIYENGILSVSVPDKLAAESVAHLALLEHPNPRRILLVGGGSGDILGEILKYKSVERVDYIEIDPLIIKTAQDFEICEYLNDRRVKIYNTDGRKYLKGTPALYDIVVVNLPDPQNLQINRFYTAEFYDLCAKHLNGDGILFTSVTASENYISPELARYLRCVYYTLNSVFPEIKIIPGDVWRVAAAKKAGYISDDYRVLESRMKVETSYIRDYYLFDTLSSEKLDFTRKALTVDMPPDINADFHPVCYFFNTTIWSTYFNNWFKKVFELASRTKLWHFLPLLLVPFIVRKRNSGSYVLLPIMTSGFSEISFQIVTITAFQALYGYVYHKLGIILTSFMIGLFLGSFCVNKIIDKIQNRKRVFLWTQVAITFYPIILPILFYALKANPKLSFLGENIIMPYIPILAGFVGGFQFPLGNRIYTEERQDMLKTAGITYGIDLCGSFLGVLLISAFILPILGITQTCVMTAIVNMTALLVMLKDRSTNRPARGNVTPL